MCEGESRAVGLPDARDGTLCTRRADQFRLANRAPFPQKRTRVCHVHARLRSRKAVRDHPACSETLFAIRRPAYQQAPRLPPGARPPSSCPCDSRPTCDRASSTSREPVWPLVRRDRLENLGHLRGCAVLVDSPEQRRDGGGVQNACRSAPRAGARGGARTGTGVTPAPVITPYPTAVFAPIPRTPRDIDGELRPRGGQGRQHHEISGLRLP